MCCKVTPPKVRNVVIHFKVRGEEGRRLKLFDLVVRARVRSEKKRDNEAEMLWLARGKSERWTARWVARRRRREGKKPGRWRGGRNGNFYTFRLADGDSTSFTVFPESCNVIATGISHPDKMWPTLVLFGEEVGLRKGWLERARITNSTYTGGIECSEKHVSACRALARYQKDEGAEYKKDTSISFRSQFFPGARIRCQDIGTVNLFNNGKYVLIGVSNDSQARRLFVRLCAIMQRYWTTQGQETSCAWSAE